MGKAAALAEVVRLPQRDGPAFVLRRGQIMAARPASGMQMELLSRVMKTAQALPKAAARSLATFD